MASASASAPSLSSSSYDTQPSPSMKRQLKLLLTLLPQLPLMARVAVLHVLGFSEQAQYLDLRGELVVSVLRALLSSSNPRSVTSTQRMAAHDAGVKGKIWVANYAAPVPPETDVRDSLAGVIESLREATSTPSHVRLPEIVSVEAEWTGNRAGATSESLLPPISEIERYREMQKEVTSPVTVLYFHGGAYYLLDPCTHRPLTRKLAQATGGRCYSVRYRLAPQNPFPAAILDALVSYMTLLYPAPDAYHEPVRPEHVVFAGDSAGGNLCLALTQVLLELRRQNRRIAWFGEERDVPLPAGVGVSSPWIDILQSSPSWDSNERFDYLPTAGTQKSRTYPPCEAWPTSPPRGQIYADDALLAHPLATLLMAQDWKEAPPVFINAGWELLADEIKFMAQKLESQGVKVVFEEYEGMPHCFAQVLPGASNSKRCLAGWAAFLKSAVEEPQGVQTRAFAVKAKTLEEVELDFKSLSDATDEDVRNRVLAEVDSIMASQETAAKL